MPSFETPPGQLLSSIPPSSDRRRSTKLGGCAGLLFQIFHGKRWLPRKSLPAERLNQATNNHTDEKLPIAKLLLIADENRIGSIGDEDDLFKDENDVTIDLHEEKSPRRAPSVVARLMGLESMPSPKIIFTESQQTELRKNADHQVCTEHLQEDRDSSNPAVLLRHSSFQRAKLREFRADLAAKFETSQRKKIKHRVAESEALPNIPSPSCHHTDTSFSSSVKGHTLNKSSMSTKRHANRIEVAPKLLKKNGQSHQSGRQQFQGSFSGAKPSSLQSKGQLTKSVAGTAFVKRHDIKVVEAMPRIASNGRNHDVDFWKLQSAQQHTNKGSSHEPTLVKGRHRNAKIMEQPKPLSLEKSMPDLRRRQDEFSRRLSQPTVSSMKKFEGTRAVRHPSPPKSLHDSSGGTCSSQASNWVPSPCEGSFPSQLTKSHVGSNNVTARKQCSSSIQESSSKHEHVDEYEDITKPSPMCPTVADMAQGSLTLRDNFDAPHSAEPEDKFYSQFDHDGSSSSAIYTESLQRSSLESSISSDPSLSEFTGTSEECSNFSSADNGALHEREEEKQEEKPQILHGIKRASDISLMQSSTESLSDSLTSSSAKETASSYSEPDRNTKIVDSVRKYSGKNTAAILQELLTALSSSTAQKKLNFDENSQKIISCMPDSEIENPLIHTNLNIQCNKKLSSESAFQDSGFFTSSDMSQFSSGNAEFEIYNLKKDSAVINELQPEDKCLSEVSGIGDTILQNGLSRDCEALMSTISKLHQIDPEAIGLKARTENNSTDEYAPLNFTSRGAVSSGVLDSDCSGKPNEQTQQLECSLLSSTSFTAEGDADSSMCRSDIESSLTGAYDEIPVWNKKLVSDCIDEAFKTLSKQMYQISSSLSEQPFATHLLSRVYMQLDEWKGMAASMNLDGMIEKEMNVTTRNWRHTGNETEEVAEVVNTTILSGLLEEVLLELM